MNGVIFACISKINQTGCFLGFCVQMGKIDKIGTKRRKFGKFWWKSPKKMRKKSKFNKHTVFNNRTGWIFPPKIINERYLISTTRLDFGPKNNKRTLHCTTIRYCRVFGYQTICLPVGTSTYIKFCQLLEISKILGSYFVHNEHQSGLPFFSRLVCTKVQK